MKKDMFVLILCFVFLFGLASIFKVSRADETAVYIRADGSIDPPTAPISTLDNFTYTFNGNIYEPIELQRNNTIIDGNGYLVQGSGGGQGKGGANLTNVSNVTVKNINIKNFYIGIILSACSDCSVIGNNLTANTGFGIGLDFHSSNNMIYGNNITDNSNSGIWLGSFGNDNVVSKNNVTNNGGHGIFNSECSNSTICGNDIVGNNMSGIALAGSSFPSYNMVYGNNITDNIDGIRLWVFNDCNNRISGNNIANNNETGIVVILVRGAPDNTIYHNNFMNNTKQVNLISAISSVKWDNGYPSGGNYWSNYTGVDLNSGIYQNETGTDGIGDAPGTIDANNMDNYPLVGIFSEFDWVSLAAPEQRIQTICNSTISNPVYNGTAISFNVTGENGTAGFCRICIPTVLLNITYKVFVNRTEVTYRLLPFSNETYSYLYFNYTHSTKEVIIIPEFPPHLILPLFFIPTLLGIIIHRKRPRDN